MLLWTLAALKFLGTLALIGVTYVATGFCLSIGFNLGNRAMTPAQQAYQLACQRDQMPVLDGDEVAGLVKVKRYHI